MAIAKLLSSISYLKKTTKLSISFLSIYLVMLRKNTVKNGINILKVLYSISSKFTHVLLYEIIKIISNRSESAFCDLILFQLETRVTINKCQNFSE